MRDGYYFGAGPAPLPDRVIERAASEFVEYQGLGVGLGELSHRSAQATDIINSACDNVRKLMNVPETHEILFVQGGGTGGFATVVYSMMAAYAKRTGRKGRADYIVTGSWSAKAAAEARRLGVDVNIVADGKTADGKYRAIPSDDEWRFGSPDDTAFIYYCDNETVDGIEFPQAVRPPAGSRLVMDISSNMFSRPINIADYAIVFGGAQKNVGIAGVSLYIVAKEVLDQPDSATLRALDVPVAPSLLDLTLVAKNNSAYNTVSIFAVQIVNLVLEGLLSRGGVEAQAKESAEKARKIYDLLDANPQLYRTPVAPESRSRMNIVFTLPDAETEKRFLTSAAERKLTGLKGHRSVGGIRISNYNAVTHAAIDELLSFMKDFAATA